MSQTHSYVQGGIMCLVCGRVSYSQNDVRERYCGNCRAFHPISGLPGLKASVDVNRQRIKKAATWLLVAAMFLLVQQAC